MPAKLNEKKGDRDLEREINNKGDSLLLQEQHDNFVAAVRKWEMLAATNARWKWAAVKKKWTKKTWKFHVVVVQNNGKEMYKKSVLHVQSYFFAN